MLLDSLIDLKKEVEKYDKIYIYGAGVYANYLATILKDIKIEAFIVSKIEDNLTSKLNPIVEYKDEIVTDNAIIIIGVIDSNFVKQIKSILRENNYIELNIPTWYIYDTGNKSSEYSGYFVECKELESIAIEEQTDKSELGHNYCNKYEFFLRKFKECPITLVELGVFKGASVRMWRSFFSKAKVIGIDIDEKCKEYGGNGIDIYIKDLSKDDSVNFVRGLQPTIVIDDASHIWSHQLNALFKIYPSLPNGGVYIVEDVCTSFFPLASQYGDTEVSAYRILEVISRGVVSNSVFDTEAEDVRRYMPQIKEIISNTEVVVNMKDSVILIKR